MLIKEMDLSKLMSHAQHIDEVKLKEKEIKNKKAMTSNLNFSQCSYTVEIILIPPEILSYGPILCQCFSA